MLPAAASALQIFVGRLEALSPLSREEVEALRSLKVRVTNVRANADIVLPGAQFEHAVLVASGLVGRYLQLADGRRQVMSINVAGEIADLHRVAAPKAGSALQALTNATILLVSGNDLRALALASPRITQAFWTYSAIDAAILSRWAAILGRREAKVRMAHLLCEIGLRLETSGQALRTEFLLELTQTQIADALGLTPVHVNRTLKALREIGAVEVEGRIFRISDWPLLAAIGEFDPEYLQIMSPNDEAA
ncbi:MAG TPA: Crp/Fnr family transcriptional regulator [Sphingomicrobium sp.]|jgi:CRP-like cAMP-binding protein|nr:Crp/Fnr family transcriptional regulator [Sphingomicrobium sp.]